MKKINGHLVTERDPCPGFRSVGNTKIIRNACDRFLRSRGLKIYDFGDVMHADIEGKKARNKR